MNKKKKIAVGGQAVIEGVMMRGPKYIATAIRRKDDTIEVIRDKFISLTKKKKSLNIPILRGFISLIEMLSIGFKTLSFSAKRFELDYEAEMKEKGEKIKEKSNFRQKAEEIFSYIFAFGLAFLFFAFLPYQLADLADLKQNLYFNLFAGVIRILFFVLYVFLISKLKDVHRVFEYHGAEHKSVHAYEKGFDLGVENVKEFTTLHPRCGTSFIFFVLLVSILIFSIVDTIVAIKIGHNPHFLIRLGYHILLIPFVSGISYEVLKLSGKNINHPIVKIFTFPGLSLQRITTQPPDEKQLEVAIISMKYALEMDIDKYKNVKILKGKSK